MSSRDLWRTLYERFDPELPPLVEWRVPRPHSPAKRIGETLDRPFGTPRILVMGTVGTGKTTELLRVAEAREERELVVFLDLARHSAEVVKDPRALDRIDAWEVCFLAGLALVARWGATLATTALVGPVGEGVSKGFEFLKSLAGSVRNWSLPLGRGEQAPPDQERHVQELLGAINLLVGEVQSKHRRVLFVIDGLDRIRELDRAKALFVDSQLLSLLACPVVVCGPFVLRHHVATAGVRGFKTERLVNEPVLDHAQPERHGPGVNFFRELYAQRVKDLGEQAQGLVSHELLGELAYRSGGRSRDFVRFIRSLAEVGWDQDAPTATPEMVKQVLDEWRMRQETGLHKGHIHLLEEVAKDPQHVLPQDELAYELLESAL